MYTGNNVHSNNINNDMNGYGYIDNINKNGQGKFS